jgi:NADH dehydrogenase [ubiquinone] 1 alpha subcomplex assembly factor 6
VNPAEWDPMAGIDSTQYCLDDVRRHDHDRYLCALFLPARIRDAAIALLAFNAEIARTREIVSEPLLGQIRLQWWRDTLDEISAGKVREHPVVSALAAAMSEHGIERTRLDAMIDAREADLEDAPPRNLAALEAYARATSGNLTASVMGLLGDRAPAFAAAEEVGTAWALVGLARAVAFHAQTHRLFVPEDLLSAYEIERRSLFDLKPTPGLNRAIADIAGRAHELLASARAARESVTRAERRVLLPAVLADRYIADMAQAGNDPFAFPASQPARALRLAWAAWRGRY